MHGLLVKMSGDSGSGTMSNDDRYVSLALPFQVAHYSAAPQVSLLTNVSYEHCVIVEATERYSSKQIKEALIVPLESGVAPYYRGAHMHHYAASSIHLMVSWCSDSMQLPSFVPLERRVRHRLEAHVPLRVTFMFR